MEMKHKVFVYGTLKKGFGNHRFLKGASFIGNARTMDHFALYESGLPFVIENEAVSTISGELYEVSEETLVRLDCLEGHPGFYTRKMVNVSIFPGNDGESQNTYTAWLYFFPEKKGVLVKSGVFH